MEKTLEEKLREISQGWFYSEPLLFSVICTHTLVENSRLSVPMRSGRQVIEFSSALLKKYNDSEVEDFLKIEVFRILLMHPYSRLPHNANRGILLLASDVTINQFYKPKIPLSGVEYLKDQAQRFNILEQPLGEKWKDSEEEKFFKRNLNVNRQTGNLETLDSCTFEEWYRWILFLVKETSLGGGENVGKSSASENYIPSDEAAELWEEDQEIQGVIQSEIQKAEREQGWGGLGGGLSREIMRSADFSMDYRKILSRFRANVLSTKRTLTRMKPNRRFGFKAMGSRWERKANILIAVDVSGSISDESFANFFHVINNFFVYGIEKLDLIFFDTNLKYSKPVTIKKKIDLNEIKGRGGTNFQPALDFYFEHNEYNGLIIFTDGEGNIPCMRAGKTNVLWILSSRVEYERSRQWISKLNGNQATYLPF